MPSPRILLFEDNEDNRALSRQVTELMGVDLIEATNGLEGVRFARAMAPRVILMDLNLPLMTGWEAASALKADAATAGVPIIALTAHAMDGDERRAREAGCDGYVTKPIDVVALMGLLEGYLAR